MMDGVNIDVAVVQLVELEIVILVVMGSTPIGHPNNEGMVEKYTTHSHAGLSLSELCLYDTSFTKYWRVALVVANRTWNPGHRKRWGFNSFTLRQIYES